ncbi:DUF2071 domain-containing protein [Catellatospora citrea]|uniref:Acetoacetate decarboxylase n=1 Tax=Catellatospora citrea TaxID=53366 RepID=A0A8J3KQR9_9ACTN|nr:DUF2071 domain-containing protein [Catellatospora citrea]GIG00280.1 hypothetical protein Cci01nite_53730 [Catellatospora citrea]
MLPRVHSEIQRRLLVNYRADPDLVARLLPEPFRPQLVRDAAVVGICLIRLAGTRLPGMPHVTGLPATENGAHRLAVEWDTADGVRGGVFIPRRDSHSRTTVALGGRLYPGWHHRSVFTVAETDTDLRVSFRSTDDETSVDVHARITDHLTGSTLFADLDEAARFFRTGADGYSVSRRPGVHEGLRLVSSRWDVEPAQVLHARSSFYDDRRLFPTGTVELDGALVMRHLPVTWQALPPLERKGTFTSVSV